MREGDNASRPQLTLLTGPLLALSKGLAVAVYIPVINGLPWFLF